MIAAIAYMGGLNLRDEKVKTLVYTCLVGNFAKDVLQERAFALEQNLLHLLLSVFQKKPCF